MSWFVYKRVETIESLKHDLSTVRWTVLSLMPEDVQRILGSYYDCGSEEEALMWENITAEKIIALAEILQSRGWAFFGERAYCPLCKNGSNSPFEEGFAVPEGLRRHLVGWGNTHQCGIFKVALDLARDYWYDKFHEKAVDAEKEKSERTLSRRKTETLYCVAPDLDPELIDEGIGYGVQARNETEMVWAEQRLADLGFSIIFEANFKTYLSDQADFVVYADPRKKGEIKFTVYKKPLPKKGRGSRSRPWAWNSFELRDNWKHDLSGKYRARLEAMLDRIQTV